MRNPETTFGRWAAPLITGATFAFLSTRFPVGDSDTFWQLATARDFLMRGLGHGDLFSWTAAGRPVATDQWLGQLVLHAAFSLAGWPGLVAVRALAVAAIVALVVRSCLDARPGRPLIALLASLPAIFLVRFVSAERPELLGFVCFAVLITALRRGQAGSDRALIACVPLVAVWANLHGSFALGVVLIALVCGHGWVTDPARRRTFVLVALAALAASLATPSGIGSWTAPGLHFTAPPRAIQEWAVPDLRTLPGALFASAFVATLGLALLTRAAGGWREAVILAPLLFLSLTAQRQLPYFAIGAAAFIASRLPWPERAAGNSRMPARVASAGTAALVALLLITVALGAATGPREPDLSGYPSGALADLDPGPGLFNQYDWGGYLIAYAPHTPVFIDGRLVPYLGATLDDYAVVLNARPGWRDVVSRWRIRALLVRPEDPVAVRAAELGWGVRARGGSFVLFAVP